MNIVLRLVLLSCAAAPAMAASELDTWVDRELVPYVLETVTSHPRFKDQRVRFVVFDGDDTAASASELALGIRDRLVDAAIEAGGIHIATPRASLPTDPARLDCTRTDAHYAIGIAVAPHSRGQWQLTLRARDLLEERLVPGFGKKWRGYLEPRERLAATRSRADATLLGERGAPFESHQGDLLAAHLAHELACAVARQTGGLYVVPQDLEPDGDDVFGGTLALIGNNVTAHPAFDLAASADEANAALAGKAHRIDGSLYQYWLTLSPTNDDGELSALSASAYVRLPGRLDTPRRDAAVARDSPGPRAPRAPRGDETVGIPQAASPLLGALRLRPAGASDRCPAYDSGVRGAHYGMGRNRCSLLEATAKTDAVVFVVSHRPSLGLVRIDDGTCRRRVQPMLVREHQTRAVAVPWVPDDGARIRDVSTWQAEPRGEVYYAIAVADSALARRVANHVDRLPLRCEAGPHRGIRKGALRNWLAGLDAIAARADGRVDWRAIELRRVY